MSQAPVGGEAERLLDCKDVPNEVRRKGLAKTYGRYGYRKVGELLRAEGWRINHMA